MTTFTEQWYTDTQLQMLGAAYNAARKLQGDIIEIGCWEGKSTVTLANICYPETLIAVDSWLGNTAETELTGREHETQAILKTRDVYSTFTQNIAAGTKGNVQVIKDDCFNWLATYQGQIKFCHIDASHDYPSVRRTIEALLPRLVPGAVLCGDDVLYAHKGRADLLGGVERAVSECLPGFRAAGNFWWWMNFGERAPS